MSLWTTPTSTPPARPAMPMPSAPATERIVTSLTAATWTSWLGCGARRVGVDPGARVDVRARVGLEHLDRDRARDAGAEAARAGGGDRQHVLAGLGDDGDAAHALARVREAEDAAVAERAVVDDQVVRVALGVHVRVADPRARVLGQDAHAHARADARGADPDCRPRRRRGRRRCRRRRRRSRCRPRPRSAPSPIDA